MVVKILTVSPFSLFSFGYENLENLLIFKKKDSIFGALSFFYFLGRGKNM